MTEVYFYCAIGLYVLASFSVSVFLIKRDDLDTFQKSVQTILVWLIPILGAIIFWRVNKSHDIAYEKTKAFGGGAGRLGAYDSAGDGGGSD
ncbi:hypothetical protein [Aliiglaciecola lipolytica]|uniref:Uncharacterized protein n=2 Tax=Aliiglaciecola TaxID=1406885 RepID=K6YBE7_9ALTE|nr:hypothetical protein [Aliiglaciecola lipolytica]GAC12721.1 hypothetical protein GLIP_0066 [Aliiglaciecola lipolytica E3]GAC13963.1 hypothetical protein GLIP_1322 [Aliiglaciecola lipolytica E3]